jgi:hypothetical protein
MTRSATTWVALGLVAALALGASIGRLSAKDCPLDPRRQKLDNYCAQVNAAMYLDVRELGMPKYQQEAAFRFGELTTFHSEQEIELCSEHLPKLDTRDACMLRKDYKCLEELARAAHESTKR